MTLKSLLKPHFLAPLLASFVVLLIIFSPVFAAPGSYPPTGTVNSSFNSLSVAGVANFSGGLSIDANGVIKHNSGSAIRINSNQGLTVADNAGVATFSVSGSTGGLINPKTNDPVKIADPDGFAIQPSTGTARLLINAQGELSNPQSGNTSRVRIVDTEGFSVGSGVSDRFFVDGTGQIYSPGIGSPVKIIDPDGLLVAYDSAANLGLQINGDGSLTHTQTGSTNGRVTIADSDGIQVLDNGSVPQFRLDGNTGNINTNGWITAQDGIGAYGIRSYSQNINPGASISSRIYCTGGERLISCSYSTINAPYGAFDIRSMYPSNDYCEFQVRNNTASTYNFTKHALCFDPSVHFHPLD